MWNVVEVKLLDPFLSEKSYSLSCSPHNSPFFDNLLLYKADIMTIKNHSKLAEIK